MIELKLEHLRSNFGFEESDLDEIAKLYRGENYDPKHPAILALKDISHELCEEWNHLFTGEHDKKQDKKREKALLKLLFPGLPSTHGLIRRNLQLVIGMVEVSPYTFINVGANFGENTLVRLGRWAQIGPNFSVMEEEGSAQSINIEDEAWLGGKVKVKAGVTISSNSVVGAGAYVTSDIPSWSLALGRPAAVKKVIANNEGMSIKPSMLFSEAERDHIEKHYRRIKHPLPRKQIDKIFTGNAFSTFSIRLGMLYLYTQGLCTKLDNPNLSEAERAEIIDILFPHHGKNISIGKHFFLDLCGVVTLGDNVSIGDNVCLGGLIRIGDNVSIGDGCVFFSSNHPLSPKERKFGFHKGQGLSIPIYLSPIEIGNDVHIGNDVVLAPCCKIASDIPNDSLVLAKGQILPLE